MLDRIREVDAEREKNANLMKELDRERRERDVWVSARGKIQGEAFRDGRLRILTNAQLACSPCTMNAVS